MPEIDSAVRAKWRSLEPFVDALFVENVLAVKLVVLIASSNFVTADWTLSFLLLVCNFDKFKLRKFNSIKSYRRFLFCMCLWCSTWPRKWIGILSDISLGWQSFKWLLSLTILLIDYSDVLVQTLSMSVDVSFKSRLDCILDRSNPISCSPALYIGDSTSHSFQLIQTSVEITDLNDLTMNVARRWCWCSNSTTLFPRTIHLRAEISHGIW